MGCRPSAEGQRRWPGKRDVESGALLDGLGRREQVCQESPGSCERPRGCGRSDPADVTISHRGASDRSGSLGNQLATLRIAPPGADWLSRVAAIPRITVILTC